MTGNELERAVVDVVVRCRNEMPYTERALEALERQRGVRARVLFIDCDSTDGSREVAEAAMRSDDSDGLRLEDWDPAAYVPGQVLNHGMRATESGVVAFVNADAVALHDDALARLVEPLEDPAVAATFARQLPRPDADPLTRQDYARAFGPEAPPAMRVGSFFSMAASAIRRDVWERLPFDEDLRYSEDVDWTARCAGVGYRIVYVPEARFEHSHAYDLRAHFKRRAGEGTADTAIHRMGPPSMLRELLRPLAGSVLRDVRAGVLSPTSVATRAMQSAGYYVGRTRATRRRAS